jgi:hypothetical protein
MRWASPPANSRGVPERSRREGTNPGPLSFPLPPCPGAPGAEPGPPETAFDGEGNSGFREMGGQGPAGSSGPEMSATPGEAEGPEGPGGSRRAPPHPETPF